MQLTLVLPNMLEAAPAALDAADAPALARLLSTAPPPVIEPDGPLAIACAGVGIKKQNDWPVAPWLVRAAGIDPGSRYWLCAEPVTLEVGRDEVRLACVVGASAAKAHGAVAAFRAASPAASALVWLDDLKAPDTKEQLTAFDSEWAAPLERALDKRELDVTLVIAGAGAALSFTPRA